MSTLSAYSKVRRLGRGSFGEVFLVRTSSGQHYVLKEVDLSQFGQQQAGDNRKRQYTQKEKDAWKREALKEVNFLKILDHPYIVGFKDCIEGENQLGVPMLYIIMEYADAGDLASRIKALAAANNSGNKNKKNFPESQVLDWFVMICLALKHIHDKKIIHRDIKSENIFLNSNGQVKLGDFGISKSMQFTLQNAMTRIGTPYYLSPEICAGRPYNNKSDMWSLGVVLYELLCLRHPFDANSMENLLQKIVKSNYSPPPKQYSAEIKAILDGLLQKNPNKRPSVSAILNLPFLKDRVLKFNRQAQPTLNSSREEEYNEDFEDMDNFQTPALPPTNVYSTPATAVSHSQQPHIIHHAPSNVLPHIPPASSPPIHPNSNNQRGNGAGQLSSKDRERQRYEELEAQQLELLRRARKDIASQRQQQQQHQQQHQPPPQSYPPSLAPSAMLPPPRGIASMQRQAYGYNIPEEKQNHITTKPRPDAYSYHSFPGARPTALGGGIPTGAAPPVAVHLPRLANHSNVAYGPGGIPLTSNDKERHGHAANLPSLNRVPRHNGQQQVSYSAQRKQPSAAQQSKGWR